MSKPVIGFIGLGLMGGNMVENLQKRGFGPIVMDLNKDAVTAVVARGATEATSAAELRRLVTSLCLPSQHRPSSRN
ncbi:MAG: 3-hydroxyisobutyrate dehydrogenase-like beta-hydroxyacid dehydrogenase [Arenicella sp.]|jgi:3-hydroxyisobutyrate dehydrogenase-like beta-hydroxyacid dehydrogenase